MLDRELGGHVRNAMDICVGTGSHTKVLADELCILANIQHPHTLNRVPARQHACLPRSSAT